MFKLIRYLYSRSKYSFRPAPLQCHRGYWVEGLKENTLEAVQKSYELGYQIVEFDVRMTADGEVVLFHDKERFNKKIAEIKYTDLCSQESVSTLKDVLKWYQTARLYNPLQTHKQKMNSNPDDTSKYYFYLNIEIKSDSLMDRRLEQKVLDLLNKYDVADSVLISSFNPLVLAYIRVKSPLILRSLLLTYENENWNNRVLKSQILNFLAQPHFLHLDERSWNQKKFKPFLDLKIPIVLWTCNDLDSVKTYFEQGIYGIISDRIQPKDLQCILGHQSSLFGSNKKS